MASSSPLVCTEIEEIVLYAEVRCRACFAPGLIKTSGQRPLGRIGAGQLYVRQRRYERLGFRCDSCGYQTADLVDVTEANIRITTPEPDPHPALPRPQLFLCEAPA